MSDSYEGYVIESESAAMVGGFNVRDDEDDSDRVHRP